MFVILALLISGGGIKTEKNRNIVSVNAEDHGLQGGGQPKQSSLGVVGCAVYFGKH